MSAPLKCGHEFTQDGCLYCLERTISNDEAQRAVAAETAKRAAPEREDAALLSEILSVLREHAGEAGESESAVEVARRLSAFWKNWGAIIRKIRELDALTKGVPTKDLIDL